MGIMKEPEHDARNMVGHADDDVIVYHLKRIQVLLLLIAIATLYMAAASRVPNFL